MLTFERLVQETAAKLAESGIEPGQVREVLSDAGIDTTLHEANTLPQGRLIVHNVRIVGEKQHTDHRTSAAFNYYRELGSGLWAWVGDNGTGKSTILNCILWALTGSDSEISKRVRPWIRDVGVQFSVGSEPYTSRVTRLEEGVSGGIYRGHLTLDQIDLGQVEPEILFENRDEMREAIDLFFMQHLGISTLRWTSHGSQKDDPDLHAHSTTWRTYAHAIHIEDDSYDDLIIDPQKGYGRQDRKILEMMLGVDHSRAVAEIQVEADFAREAYGRARSRVSGKQGVVDTQIIDLEGEMRFVQAQIESLQNPQAPVDTDQVFIEKRERRAALLTEQNRLDAELYRLGGRVSELEAEILDIEREKIAITEQSEVEYLINSLAVVRCPHCEAPVDAQDRLVMERQQHTCHVCAQPLQRTRTRGDLKTVLRERDQDIGDR
ncbi:MAG TPA: ATP-binding protein, partial [Aggregatilineales bacterium]|nr:ATP-binding protein [Aggregatilineales bacterium]